ncbi:MAG: hypothetical protein IJ194_06030 [Bacilli bacterium]|nr:hypothetical protein [Bacilli bacterium]
MKKLKVILPAILTLAVSTSAAVTGTVAWFTATRLRTVAMDNVTVVNPEEGLNLLGIKNVANTKITGTTGTHGQLVTPATQPTVTHANDGTNQGVLRDASVDVENGKVYKALITEEGAIAGYAEQAIGTKDTKTYNEQDIYYATAFTTTFGVSRVGDPGYDSCLFLDLNASLASKPGQGTGATTDVDLYNAVRIGLKCGTNWFVWAPFATIGVKAEKAADAAMYVNGEVGALNAPATDEQRLAKQTLYTAANFVKAHNTSTATDTKLNDSETLVDADYNTAEYGYLGTFTKVGTAATADADADGLDVTVYTWFEGTDPILVNTNFTTQLAGLTANLKFILRRVEK